MPVTAGNGLPKGYMSGYPPAPDRCQVVEVTWCLKQPFKGPVRVEDSAPLSKDNLLAPSPEIAEHDKKP